MWAGTTRSHSDKCTASCLHTLSGLKIGMWNDGHFTPTESSPRARVARSVRKKKKKTGIKKTVPNQPSFNLKEGKKIKQSNSSTGNKHKDKTRNSKFCIKSVQHSINSAHNVFTQMVYFTFAFCICTTFILLPHFEVHYQTKENAF